MSTTAQTDETCRPTSYNYISLQHSFSYAIVNAQPAPSIHRKEGVASGNQYDINVSEFLI
jgi:hypothetical protein